MYFYAKVITDLSFRLFAPDGADPYDYSARLKTMELRVNQLINLVLDEAAQLANDIDSGKYTTTKTAAEAILAMKVELD